MDSKDLQPAIVIRNANVQLTVESAKATKCRVNGVWSVGGCNDHYLAAALDAIHEGQQLRNNALLNLATGLVSLGRNGVNLIDEDDRWRILFCLLKGLAQIGLCLSCHLGHDLRTIDEEEESSGLVCNGPGNEGLAAAWWSIQQNTTWRFHSQGLEESGVAQWQLYHLADLAHGFLAAADVVIPHFVQPLLILSLHRLTLAMDDSVWGNNHELTRVNAHHLELNWPEPTPHKKEITLACWTVGFQEVWLQVCVEKVPCDALNGVI
mmetsp:Transcript_53913/g.120597  ORF Transcript_53913/g.120597 Transcript_53913/m.120597 type:complete len:265 (+) Transcript_53913:1452-2246(+)